MNQQWPSPYHAYVLRCWQETSQMQHEQPAWRFSLQDVSTRQRRSFASLVELTSFLENNLLDVTPNVTDEQI